MELLEGVVEIGDDTDGENGEAFPDVAAFVDALDAVGEAHGVTVQAFDARYVVSRRHLERAVELADRERDRGAAIARDRGVEILLYAAGRRQIDRALEMGVGEGTTSAVVLVDEEGDGSGSDDERTVADESAAADAVREFLDGTETLGHYDEERVRTFFEISDRELAATAADIETLVAERVALLVVER